MEEKEREEAERHHEVNAEIRGLSFEVTERAGSTVSFFVLLARN